MVFKCKEKEKNVVPIEVSIEEYGENVAIFLDDIHIASFDSEDGSLTCIILKPAEIERLEEKSVAIDGCCIEIAK